MPPEDIERLRKTLEKQPDEEIVEIGPDGTIRTAPDQNIAPAGGKRTVLHDPRGEY